MKGPGRLTRALALTGTVLMWLPLLAPVALFLPRLGAGRPWHFDYLMPAELMPVALAGAILLLWAAGRARARRGLIGGSLAAAGLCLVGGQVLAVVTGLASGETEPTGWPWALVLAALAGYALALAAGGAGGALLVRDLFRPARPA